MVGSTISIIQNEDVSSVSIVIPQGNFTTYNMQSINAVGKIEYGKRQDKAWEERFNPHRIMKRNRDAADLYKRYNMPSMDFAYKQLEALEKLEKFLKSSRKFNGVTIGRVRSRLRKLFLRNLTKSSCFATLTWEIEPSCWKEALVEVQKWVRKMGEVSNGNAKIVYVPELGEIGGRLHVHAVITGNFNGKAKKARDAWKHGNCDTQTIKKGTHFEKCSKIAHYICKYITKSCVEMEGRTRAYYITQNWDKDYIHAYMNSEQAKKINKAFQMLRQITPKAKVAIKSFSIEQIELQSFNYTIPNTDLTTVLEILHKKGIAYFKDAITGISKEKEKLLKFKNVLMSFALKAYDKKLIFADYDNLKKCLPDELSEEQKIEFIKKYAALQKEKVFVLDPVKYSSVKECEWFIAHPRESALELNAAFIMKPHKIKVEVEE